MKKRGFTLIELLVVIAIVGLISTLSILSLNSARARSRDAKRVTDIKQIQTALEMYYNEMNDYPPTDAIVPGLPIGSSDNIFMSAVPKPPTTIDGDACPSPQPAYTYTRLNPAVHGVASYTLSYCLGARAGNIVGNKIQTASPFGLFDYSNEEAPAGPPLPPRGLPPVSPV